MQDDKYFGRIYYCDDYSWTEDVFKWKRRENRMETRENGNNTRATEQKLLRSGC